MGRALVVGTAWKQMRITESLQRPKTHNAWNLNATERLSMTILGFRIQPGPHFKPLPRNQWRLHWRRSATERLRVQRGEPADSDHKHQTKGKRQTEHKLPENLIMNLTGRKRKDGYGLRLHAAFSRTASQKSQLYNIILLNHLLIIFM